MRKKITSLMCMLLLSVLGAVTVQAQDVEDPLANLTGAWYTSATDDDGNVTYTPVEGCEYSVIPSEVVLIIEGGQEGWKLAQNYSGGNNTVNLINPNGASGSMSRVGYSWQFDAEGKCYIAYTFPSQLVFPEPIGGEYSIDCGESAFAITDPSQQVPNDWGGTSALNLGVIGDYDTDFSLEVKEYFLLKDDFTGITPEPGDMKVLFNEWTATWSEDIEITSHEANEVKASASTYDELMTRKALLVQGETSTGYIGELDVEFDYTNRTIKFTTTDEIKSKSIYAGDYYIRLLPGQFYFNGDESKVNGYIQFGPYTYPNYRTLQIQSPEVGQVVSFDGDFTIRANGAYIFRIMDAVVNEGDPAKLLSYDEATETWNEVCDLEITLGLTNADGTQQNNYDYYEFTLSIPEGKIPTEPGKYKVSVPAAMMSLFEKSSPSDKEYLTGALDAEYELVALPNLNLIPTYSFDGVTPVEQDALYEGEWSEMTFTFPGDAVNPITSIEYVGEFNYDEIIRIEKEEEFDFDGSIEKQWVGYPSAEDTKQLNVEIENNVVKVSMDADAYYPYYPLDKDGKYRVVIPKGKFAFNGYDLLVNDEITFEFNVDAVDPTISMANSVITPAPGEIETPAITYEIVVNVTGELSLGKQNVIVGWDPDKEEDIYEERDAQATLIMESSYGMASVGTFNISIEGNKLTLTPDETSIPVDQEFQAGKYYLVIDKKTIFVDGDANKFNERLEFGAYEKVFRLPMESIDPEAGVVESLSKFTMVFEDSNYYTTDTEYPTGGAKLYKFDEETEEYVELYTMRNYVEEVEMSDEWGTWNEPVCTVNLPEGTEPITEEGKYKLVVDNNAFAWSYYDYWGGGSGIYESKGFEVEYTIEKAIDLEAVFTPTKVTPENESVVEKLNEIVVEFDNEYLTLLMDGGATVTVTDAEGNLTTEGWLSMSDATPKTVKIVLDNEVKQAGTYTVVIPAGKIYDYFDETLTNPSDIKFTYTIEESEQILVDFETTPGKNEIIYDIEEIFVTFNGVESVTYVNDPEKPVALNYSDPEVGGQSPINVMVETVEGVANQVKVTADAKYTLVGEYTLYFPAGAFYYNDDKELTSEEAAFTFVINPEVTDIVTTNPAQGDLDLATIGGTFRAVNVIYEEGVKPNPDFDGEITLSINGVVVDKATKYSSGELETELGIIFSQSWTQNGTYVVTVPRGAAYVGQDGYLSSSQTFTWNVTGGWDKREGITVDPEDKSEVASLSKITLTFNEYEAVGKNLWFSYHFTGKIELKDANGEIVADGYMQPSELSYNSVEIMLCEKGSTSSFIEIVDKGEYTLTIPEGMVNFKKNGKDPYEEGLYNKQLVYTWTVDGSLGVDSFESDAADLNIYSVNGMLIKRNGTKEDLKNLETGIYVVNGKKVFVRK